MTESGPLRSAAAGPPPLTMPPAEAEALGEAYSAAGVILEYGAGGSTLVAAGSRGKTVFAVESDAAWLQRMHRWFAAHPPAATVHLHHANIGPTGEWGHPKDESTFRRWPSYPNSVWDRADFLHPDVVLIDGRFRIACLLTAAFRITRPVVALFDDYGTREAYRQVEQLLRPVTMIGRLAVFELTPRPVPPERLGWIAQAYLRPL